MHSERRESHSWDVETVCCPLAAPDSYDAIDDDDLDPDPEGEAETVQIASQDFRAVAAAARAVSQRRAEADLKTRPIMPEEAFHTARLVPKRPTPPSPPRISSPPPSSPAPSLVPPARYSAPPPPPSSMPMPMSPSSRPSVAPPPHAMAAPMTWERMAHSRPDMPKPIKLSGVRFRPIWIITAVVLALACVRIIPAATKRVDKVTTQMGPKDR